MKNNFLIFLIIGILLFAYFYFSDIYFTLNIGDTYYVINYFYPILFVLGVGSVFYFLKQLKDRKS